MKSNKKVRQRESFNILLSNWDRVKELTEESANAAGTADEKYSAYMDSMEAATKRLQNAWEGFTQSLETSTVIKDVTNLAAGLTENALGGLGWLKQLTPLLLTVSSGSIVSSFTNGGVTGGFKGLIKSIPIVGDLFKRNEDIANIAKDVHAIKEETAGVGTGTKAGGGFFKKAFGLNDIIIDPTTGKSVSHKDIMKYRKRSKPLIRKLFGLSETDLSDEYDEDTVKASDMLFKRQSRYAGFGAVSALLMQLATTKQVGAGVSGWVGKLFTGNLGNEQTIEETAADKTGRVIASTLGAGIGGWFGGPLGAMLGQTIGEGAASIVSTIVHRSELEMKQRVADAKEQLNVLQDIKTISEDGNSIMSEKFLDSSGYEKLNTYVDNLVSELGKLDVTISDKILKAVRETGKTTASTISQLGDDILNASVEDRKKMQRVLNVAIAKQSYDQLVASQEGERADLAKLKMKSHIVMNSSNRAEYILKKYGTYDEETSGLMGGIRSAESFSPFGTSLEERFENAQAAYKEIGIKHEGFESFINELRQAIETEKQMDKELRNAQIQIASLRSGVSDLTQKELTDLTIDGVAGKVVKALENMGIAVRDTSGVIKSEYLTRIKSMIKADSNMSVLTKGDVKRIGELEASWDKFTEVFGDVPGIYDKVREALDKGKFEEYLEENKIQGSAEALEKLVYVANPERIEQFASAWNMTVEAALELAKIMPNLTTATGLMSTTEISEKMSKISAIFSDLSKDGKLTIENFNAILKNYPEYVDQLEDYEALLGSLGKTLTDESLFSYQNALFTSLMPSEEYYKQFEKQLPEDLKQLLTGTDAKTLTDVLDLAQTDKDFAALNEELTAFLNKTYELEADNPLKDLAIEVSEWKLDKQIDNLNQQKEALGKINDERKKELEYIKAKIALEDAQKEKKRVYRQGIIMPLSNYIG